MNAQWFHRMMDSKRASNFTTQISALQYHQSWAYANNVNFLAANTNWQFSQSTGTAIYAGRFGALKSFVSSDIPTSKVLVATVPIRWPSVDFTSDEKFDKMDEFPEAKTFEMRAKTAAIQENDRTESEYDKNQLQQDLTLFGMEFLDFSILKNHSGTVCKDGLCCNYDIGVRENANAASDDNRVCSKLFEAPRNSAYFHQIWLI